MWLVHINVYSIINCFQVCYQRQRAAFTTQVWRYYWERKTGVWWWQAYNKLKLPCIIYHDCPYLSCMWGFHALWTLLYHITFLSLSIIQMALLIIISCTWNEGCENIGSITFCRFKDGWLKQGLNSNWDTKPCITNFFSAIIHNLNSMNSRLQNIVSSHLANSRMTQKQLVECTANAFLLLFIQIVWLLD